jgi:hypothetical protein
MAANMFSFSLARLKDVKITPQSVSQCGVGRRAPAMFRAVRNFVVHQEGLAEVEAEIASGVRQNSVLERTAKLSGVS